MKTKLIIFDLDGTLIDSLDDLTTAVNFMRASFGLPPVDRGQVRAMVGQGARSLVERALPGSGAEEIERGLRLFLEFNEAHLVEHTCLYPGVAATLTRLAEQQPTMVVVSNKNENLCRRLVELLGIDSHFAAVFGADSLPARKPSPEPLRHVMRHFGVSQAGTVMVGDSINDIAAGNGAGVITVGCTFGYGDAT
ncbi:MAG TPA: HAD-IIIA family hydrolase, partial [Geobacteraceae bacterium]